MTKPATSSFADLVAEARAGAASWRIFVGIPPRPDAWLDQIEAELGAARDVDATPERYERHLARIAAIAADAFESNRREGERVAAEIADIGNTDLL